MRRANHGRGVLGRWVAILTVSSMVGSLAGAVAVVASGAPTSAGPSALTFSPAPSPDPSASGYDTLTGVS